MVYRTFVSMKVALIGTGEIAERFALQYAAAGHEVLMAWKTGDKGINPRLAMLENITVCSIEEAAQNADMIIVATSPADVREVAYWLGDVRGKVIIDATANIPVSQDEQVNTFWAIKAITGSLHIVKVFSTRGYEQLLKPLFKHDRIQLILAGDSRKAKEIVKILTIDLGTNKFFDMGGSEVMPLFNELTAGWRRLAQTSDKTIIATNPIRI
jgi:predicted dinucleotide-binding enzyme